MNHKSNIWIRNIFSLVLIFCLFQVCLYAQTETKDTAKAKGQIKELMQRLASQVYRPYKENQQDSLPNQINSMAPYLLYRGYTIRRIFIKNIKFGKSINGNKEDSSRTRFIDRLTGKLHKWTTKEQIIYNDLFFKCGDTVNPGLMADNERYIRNLAYIQNARITLIEVPSLNETSDSVDVFIYFKDVLSLSGSSESNNTNFYQKIEENNLIGTGDRLSISGLYDQQRRPMTGAGFSFTQRNIKGTFLDFTLGYANLNKAFNNGEREEESIQSNLELPLVSPYYYWTGALAYSNNFNKALYEPASIFNSELHYHFEQLDGWIGYNISRFHLFKPLECPTLKKFITGRIIHTDFLRKPDKYKNTYNFLYSSQTSLLSSLVLFNQEYFKTKYIYGFGRDEDVPEGYNISFIGGWTNKNNLNRPYAGLTIDRYRFNQHQSFLHLSLQAGAYYYQKQFQDVTILLYHEAFSRLYDIGSGYWKVRYFFYSSLTQQYHNRLNEPLFLNSTFSSNGFSNPDSLGSTRIYFSNESVFFNHFKLLNFHMAPFSFFNCTIIKAIGEKPCQSDIFPSMGLGLRTRNEDLVFGTIEFKLSYFPRTTPGMTPFNLNITTNLRFKYDSRYVAHPEFISGN